MGEGLERNIWDQTDGMDIVERIIPNILVEDIGGENEMICPHIELEVRIRIKSIVVKEIGGVDHLLDEISDLMNY
jgi:hypothetical protein